MRRSARVLVAVTACLAVLAPPAVAVAPETRAPDPGTLRPAIEWKKIPFGAKRKRQMAAYSKRHYGERSWALTDPKVVVEHYTAGTSFDSAWGYFASNIRHLGEMPGVCSQFLIDTDGTIYQLVNLKIRCRHTVGLNWTAIGIEMVGTSARQVIDRRPQFRAALRLTLWLMARYGIELRNVIGHNENRTSPYHLELYEDWACQTHADWNKAEMRTFRRTLKRMAVRRDVPIGPRPDPVDPDC